MSVAPVAFACQPEQENDDPISEPTWRSGGCATVPAAWLDVVFDSAGNATTVEIAAMICPTLGPSLSGNPPSVSPELATLIASMPPTHLVEDVVVVFESGTAPPVLPRFDPSEPRTSRDNVAIANRRSSLFAGFKRDRLAEQQWLAEKITSEDGRVLRQNAVGSTMVADVTIDTLRQVDQDVRLAMLGLGSVATPGPPVAQSTGRSLLDARQQVFADRLWDLGYDGGPYFIGVIDTGISEHDLLEGKIASNQDCSQTVGSTCTGPDPSDCHHLALSPNGHGTSVAAIAAANEEYGPEDHGYSRGGVHGWKMKGPIGSQGCASEPGKLGEVLGIAALSDDVINLSIATSTITGPGQVFANEKSANEAFAMGAIILAGAGNSNVTDPAPNVGSPASADNVIAVGAVHANGSLAEYSSVGPMSDGRIKPDVLAPTDVFTACSDSPSCGKNFDGTSAATPSAAGAAVQLLDLYDSIGGVNSPPAVVAGRIYAALIAFGTPLSGSFSDPTDSEGAGLLHLGAPVCSRWRWGSAALGPLETMSTQLQLNHGAENVRVGIWWSDDPLGTGLNDAHAAMTIELVKTGPGGISYNTGQQTEGSTFQRLIRPNIDAGTWTLKIKWAAGNMSAGAVRHVHFLWYSERPQIECGLSG